MRAAPRLAKFAAIADPSPPVAPATSTERPAIVSPTSAASCVLTDSFLAAYQAFGPDRLNAADADRFVAEQTRIGELLGADPLPETAQELTDWITNHPDRVPTNAQASAISFLQNPPLNPPVKIGYRLLFDAALTTIPTDIRHQLGVEPGKRARSIGKNATRALRWTLGASPSWQLALVRCDAPIPDGLFRQPMPEPRVAES